MVLDTWTSSPGEQVIRKIDVSPLAETERQQSWDRFVKTSALNCGFQLGRRYGERIAIVDNQDVDAPRQVSEKEFFASLEWQKLKENKKNMNDTEYLNNLTNAFEIRATDPTNFDTWIRAQKEGTAEEQHSAAVKAGCFMEWQIIHAMTNDLGDVGINVTVVNSSMAATGNIIRSGDFHRYKIPPCMLKKDSMEMLSYIPDKNELIMKEEKMVPLGELARHPLIIISNVLSAQFLNRIPRNTETEEMHHQLVTNLLQVTIIAKNGPAGDGEYIYEAAYPADSLGNIHTLNGLTIIGNPIILPDTFHEEKAKQIYETKGKEWRVVADYSRNLFDIRRRGPMTTAVILSETETDEKERV